MISCMIGVIRRPELQDRYKEKLWNKYDRGSSMRKASITLLEIFKY